MLNLWAKNLVASWGRVWEFIYNSGWALPSPEDLPEEIDVQSIFFLFGPSVNKSEGTIVKYMEDLTAVNDYHEGLIKIELSADVFGCRPPVGRTRNSLEEATRGRAAWKLLFLWITFVCLCMCIHRPDCWPKELAGLWCCPQQLVSKKEGGAVWTVRSTPLTQAAVSTHDTRRQRMSHFTHSWKERCVSLCHLELLLSAGVWCAEGKGSGRRHGLVWGLLMPRLKSLSEQGLSYLQKRERKLKGCQWLAHCFVSAINGLS